MTDPTTNLTPVGFPKIDSSFIDPNTLRIARPWYQLLRSLWLRTGGAVTSTVTAVFGAFNVLLVSTSDQTTAVVNGVQLATGAVQVTAPVSGTPSETVMVGLSPFVYSAVFQGTAIVSGSQVEISRNSGITWFLVTLQGGAIPLLVGDKLRLTWFGNSTPGLVFLPGGA